MPLSRRSALATRGGASLLTAAFFVGSVFAQGGNKSAGIIGTLIDQRAGTSISEARIYLQNGRDTVRSDGNGRFVLGNLPPGTHVLEIAAPGYGIARFQVTLAGSQIYEHEFSLLFSGQSLPELTVEGSKAKKFGRYLDFERRRASKTGAFITRDEIESRGYMNVGAALEKVRGIHVQCDAIECKPYISRAGAFCSPTWIVDGTEVGSFHENTPIRDIQGMEIYRGASEMPAEFGGSNSQCGVIVIWTKSAP